MPHHRLRQGGVRVGVLAQRPHVVLAVPAVAAGDRERHHHAVADLEVLDAAPDLHHLAHELVAEDVALLHGRHEAVVEVQVRAADRGRGDADDRVAPVQDLRVRDVAHLDLLLAHPAGRLHDRPLYVRPPEPAVRAMAPSPAPARLPSDRTTSPVSITCLKRRRSSRSLLARLFAEQLRDQCSRRCRRAGRSAGRRALRCRDRRARRQSARSHRSAHRLPSTERQDSSSPDRSSVISASHSTVPPGAVATQCDRPPGPVVTDSRWIMNSGRRSSARQSVVHLLAWPIDRDALGGVQHGGLTFGQPLARSEVTSVMRTGSLPKSSISTIPVLPLTRILAATDSLPTPLPSPSKRMSASVKS